MINKIGRNDPCYCGSGKKYKKCCLPSEMPSITSDPLDFGWKKLRQLEGIVFDKHLIPYAFEELPKIVLERALDELFFDDLPESLDHELWFMNFFPPWLFFNWIPFDSFGIKNFNPASTISQNYVNLYEDKLNSKERHFIDEMNKTFYSFYSVIEVNIDKSLTVKDILLDKTHTIKEKLGTHQLKRGDIIFSRILTMDDQSIFIGMAPSAIPSSYHNDLIDFREWLIEQNGNNALEGSLLRERFDIELLDYFEDVLKETYDNPFPNLANTDDETIQFSKSYFKITIKPEEALKHLLPLTLSKDPNEFLPTGKSDSSVKSIEIPWLKKGNSKYQFWDNTIMGHIVIQNNRLVLETNSANRTEKGKKLLSKYLGKSVRFQKTLIESPEQKFKSLPEKLKDQDTREDLSQLPEVREQLKEFAKSHWESWFHQPIPMLKGETPIQAAKTARGREALEGLFLHYERQNLAKKEDDPFKADIAYLRSKLHL